MASALDRIASALAPELFSRDPDVLARYGADVSQAAAAAPSAVAFPRTTEDVARLVTLCGEARVPIVPSGGRTGMVGGAVAARGELVVSFERMNRLGPVDSIGLSVRVQAGATTQGVQEHCHPAGLTWPVDFASKGSSQVGGNLSTNAGGINVIRYGSARRWVLGIQAVTASGDVIELNGALEKNNTGIDLMHLIIGAEGTLALITEATLKLAPLPGACSSVLLAVRDFAEILDVLRVVREAGVVLEAFEFFDAACAAHVRARSGLAVPLGEAPYYVLMSAAGMRAGDLGWAAALLERPGVLDGVMAESAAAARALWAVRESISDSVMCMPGVHGHDLSVAIRDVGRLAEEASDVMRQRFPDWQVCVFGHVGDGNVHVATYPRAPAATDEARRAAGAAVDQTLFEVVARHGGSISAEHGIGLLKRDWLGYSRSPAEIALMKTVKQALDPAGILNPGKVYPP